nr:hypothetical protein [uncultured Pseudomonas sp.]
MAAKKSTEAEADVPVAPGRVTFRDTVYTSRSLVLPGSDRVLQVQVHTVSVEPDDVDALNYLSNHPDLARE